MADERRRISVAPMEVGPAPGDVRQVPSLLGALHTGVEVPLLPNGIGHFKKPPKLRVELVDALEAKGMQVVPPRKRLDAAKMRTGMSCRKHQVTIHPFLHWHERGKRYAHLKRDTPSTTEAAAHQPKNRPTLQLQNQPRKIEAAATRTGKV